MERRYYEGKLVQVGDVLNVKKGKSFLARSITLFMSIYKRKKKMDAHLPLYHHTGLIIEVWGRLYVAESVGKGWIVHSLEDAYDINAWNTRVDISRYDRPLSSFEQEFLCRLATQYSYRITRYDKLNFLFQIWLILTGKWIGPKGKKAENRFYCSEGVATIYNYVLPGVFPHPEATNPMDIAANENFHFI